MLVLNAYRAVSQLYPCGQPPLPGRTTLRRFFIRVHFILHRMKRESYRASEFAPRILASHGIPVVLKAKRTFISLRLDANSIFYP